MKISRILQVLGIVLVICSVGLLVGSRVYESKAKERADQIVNEIEALLPEKIKGSIEEYTNLNMPVLQMDGVNISGLIEIPAYGVTLPIGDVWDAKEVASFPRRFYGSAYDGSLIVGGADQDGQFDFCDQINPEAHIYVTDMTGTEFEYHVTRIDRAKEINLEKLMNQNAGLTLFVRSKYSMEYLIVRCNMAGTV